MKLVLTRRARRDMDSISAYTLKNWGRAQLLDYMGGLLDRMDEIAAEPEKGRSVPGIPDRFRRQSYRAHFIFFSIRGDEVRIIRILHQSMDHARHLGRSF
ncbi:type II toxin-antitoxin system RelE/ParE family toxin [Alterisphingorhabdus coralli]|uniref:Toxin n=1 Tax=Alterisphingorhabdus coralli TaxID=3071408 RepID=A0AA97F730_9SPHN|nr:type II toxin-antitoxin system RelE/ParE family toxin [Parasphingorhabdus sp. SCSIO 66989]WOE75136.1 type II toxin-antitoxin system RelE/ParE family toxin [Parasphingorhabdus sp. SCSIO 66989]